MSRHSTVEALSLYVDEELDGKQLRLVESHLEMCDDCRERLGGLRRVATRLSRLETLEPPVLLRQDVRRRIELDGVGRRLVDRWSENLSQWALQPVLVPALAVVLALAIIIYLLAYRLNQGGTGSTQIFYALPSPSTTQTSVTEVGGRGFELREGIWTQAEWLDNPDAEPQTIIDASSQDGRAWLAEHPQWNQLRRLGGRVRLELDGELVELDFGDQDGEGRMPVIE